MLIETKNSQIPNKVYELREGVQGNGEPCFVIQTVVNDVCTNQEIFNYEGEARSWLKYACN